MVPLVAVTVIVLVVVGTLKPLFEPHPVSDADAAPSSSTSISNRCRLRAFRLRQTQSNRAERTPALPDTPPAGQRAGLFGKLSLPTSAGTVTVITEVAALADPGTITDGAKLTVAPTGKPEAVNVTAVVNGLAATAEVTLMA
jgi:hypothetical protein